MQDERGLTAAAAVERHAGLAYQIARRTRIAANRRNSVSVDDLVQVGLVAVFTKWPSYDPARGASTTFLWPWIGRAMARVAQDDPRRPPAPTPCSLDAEREEPIQIESRDRGPTSEKLPTIREAVQVRFQMARLAVASRQAAGTVKQAVAKLYPGLMAGSTQALDEFSAATGYGPFAVKASVYLLRREIRSELEHDQRARELYELGRERGFDARLNRIEAREYGVTVN